MIMGDKLKKGWDIVSQVAVIICVAWLVWNMMHLVDRQAAHERQIQDVKTSMLTIDANGKQIRQDVKGLAKVMQLPSVYHQYYSSTVQGGAVYTEREKDPVTGAPVGAQIKGSMTMGDLLFEWNGKRYAIPSTVVENGWLENGQFRFNINAKNEVKVKTSAAPSLDLVFKGGYGTNQIQDQMKPYGSAELEYRIHLLK